MPVAAVKLERVLMADGWLPPGFPSLQELKDEVVALRPCLDTAAGRPAAIFPRQFTGSLVVTPLSVLSSLCFFSQENVEVAAAVGDRLP